MSNECKSDFFLIFPNFSCIFSGIFGVFSVFGCIVILQQLGRLVSVARMSGEGAGIVWEPTVSGSSAENSAGSAPVVFWLVAAELGCVTATSRCGGCWHSMGGLYTLAPGWDSA